MMRLLLALLALIVALPAWAQAPAGAEELGLLVDPFVGTLADFGQLSPAAVAPYGMVQLGPDTEPANHAGYDFAATSLAGFSHTRGVGVGCSGAGGDVRVSVNYAGAVALAPIDKDQERAHAGFYRTAYGRGIVAEMTATRGAGVIRFALAQAGQVIVTVAFDRGYSKRLAARWQAQDDGELRASFSAGTVCDQGAYHLHSASRLYHGGRPVAGWQGEETSGAAISLEVRAGDTLELRTGLSSVDAAAASAVRQHELGSFTFAQLAARTLAEWNRELARLTITGTREEQALFYTSLFRVMQTPVAIADPDGRFRNSDGTLGQLPPGEQHYTSWALWDNYRTQLPLLALLDPARAAQVARSLVRLYQAGKSRWATAHEPFLTVRTEHAGIVLLDYWRKGITGFDAPAALAGMVAESATLARATPDQQIEAAYDDWAIAEFAAELGETEIEQRFRAKALAYRPMWLATFRDLGADADVVRARGLYQGTLAQYRWAPVFDLPWLAQALGPRLRPELDRFFADNLFNMTNQPDIHVPYLFAWAGDPEAATRIVSRYLTEPVAHRYVNSGVRPEPFVGPSFALAPQGFADGMDDDAGTMSAWYIWSVLGLYPLTPGEPSYLVIPAQVEAAELRPTPGSRHVLERTRAGALAINGVAHQEGALAHGVFSPAPPKNSGAVDPVRFTSPENRSRRYMVTPFSRLPADSGLAVLEQACANLPCPLGPFGRHAQRLAGQRRESGHAAHREADPVQIASRGDAGHGARVARGEEDRRLAAPGGAEAVAWAVPVGLHGDDARQRARVAGEPLARVRGDDGAAARYRRIDRRRESLGVARIGRAQAEVDDLGPLLRGPADRCDQRRGAGAQLVTEHLHGDADGLGSQLLDGGGDCGAVAQAIERGSFAQMNAPVSCDRRAGREVPGRDMRVCRMDSAVHHGDADACAGPPGKDRRGSFGQRRRCAGLRPVRQRPRPA